MIEFQNVTLEYGGRVTALRDIDLVIEQGEFVFLVGQTGSGKSSLLKLIMRELKPTTGRVTLKGRDLGAMPERFIPNLRRQMGFVPQDIALLPNKKVWENLAYAMRSTGHSRLEVRKRVPEFLERFGILHRSYAYPAELSGGEAQRVAIARALINNPFLLLADEPTGHLDPDTSIDILNLLCDINSRGTTVLMATHDIPTVTRMEKRVIRLELGSLISDEIGMGTKA